MSNVHFPQPTMVGSNVWRRLGEVFEDVSSLQFCHTLNILNRTFLCLIFHLVSRWQDWICLANIFNCLLLIVVDVSPPPSLSLSLYAICSNAHVIKQLGKLAVKLDSRVLSTLLSKVCSLLEPYFTVVRNCFIIWSTVRTNVCLSLYLSSIRLDHYVTFASLSVRMSKHCLSVCLKTTCFYGLFLHILS